MKLTLSAPRIRRISIAVAVGLIAAIAAELIFPQPIPTILNKGDFPGLFVQAEIMARGLGEQLYNPELQRSIENELWPSFDGRFLMSVYPPTVGVVLLSIQGIVLPLAQLIYTILNVAALYCAIILWRRVIGTPGSGDFDTFIALLCFAPAFYGTLGGQNTGFSAFLLSLTVSGVLNQQSNPRGWIYAGLSAAALMYKPQFGVFALLLLVATASWRAALLAGAGCFFHYLIGAAVVGWDWPWKLLEALRQFSALNFIHNLQQQVSIVGAAKAFSFHSGIELISIVGSALGILLLGLLLFRVYQARRTPKFAQSVMILVCCLPLVVPQTLFYDLTLAALPLVALGVRCSWNRFFVLLFAIALSWATVLLRESVNLPIMAMWSIILPCAFIVVSRLQSPKVKSAREGAA